MRKLIFLFFFLLSICSFGQATFHGLLTEAQLTPVFVQSKKTDYSSSTSFSFTITTTPVEGNLMIICVGGSQARTATFPGGWTTVVLTSASTTLVTGYKLAGAGETTSVTITFNLALQGSIVYHEFSNADPNVIVNTTGVDFSAATSASLGNYNVTQPSVYLQPIGFGATSSGTSVNNGYTLIGTGFRHGAAYKIYSGPAAAENTTYSFASANGSLAMIAFRGKRL
jgi:hypothetical protein